MAARSQIPKGRGRGQEDGLGDLKLPPPIVPRVNSQLREDTDRTLGNIDDVLAENDQPLSGSSPQDSESSSGQTNPLTHQPAPGGQADNDASGSSQTSTDGRRKPRAQEQKPGAGDTSNVTLPTKNKSQTVGAGSDHHHKNSASERRKKRLMLRVAIGGVVSIFSFMGFILFGLPAKMMLIANVLKGQNDSGNEHTDGHTAIKILQRVMGLHLDKDGGYRSATGRPLHDRNTNIRIDNLKAKFAQEGITMEFDAKNRFTGLSKNGESLTGDLKDKNFLKRRSALSKAFRNLGYYNALKHVLYTKALKLHAGVSWKFWPTEKAKKLTEVLVSKVRKGAAGDAALREKPPPDDAKALEEYNKAKAAGAADVAKGNEITQKVTDTFNETHDIKKAHEAGISAFRTAANKAFGFTGLAMLYCLIQDLIEHSVDKAYSQRVELLMHAGNMILTMNDEMQTGHLYASHFGEMMQRFDGHGGNPNIPDEHNEDAKDFTKACAWKQATGEVCNTNAEGDYANYNPPLSEAANPDAAQLKGVLALTAKFFQIPGTGAVCSVLNSWFGWVILSVEFVASVASFGLKDAILKGVKGIAITLAVTLVVQKILDAATGLAVTGTENAVGLINNGDAGLNLSAKNFGRFMGNRTGTDAEAAAISEAAHQDKIALAQEKGWTYRTFALENTDSILSRTVTYVPSSPKAAIASLRSLITRIPANFGAIFFHARPAWAATTIDPYNFRPMVTTDEELDRIDPEGAEKYLMEKVNGKTRLEMLGDPNTYTPANGPDPNNNNLMHCFVNKFRAPQEEDPICKDLGVLTKSGKATAENPGPPEIIGKIFCDQYDACNENWVNELDVFCPNQPPEDLDGKCGKTKATVFDTYRVYLKATFLSRIIASDGTGVDPFAGSGTVTTAPPGSAVACLSGENQIDCAARLATAIIANPNIEKPGDVLSDLQATVNKQTLTCAPKPPARLHPALLYALNQTASPTGGSFKIRISGIGGFVHPHACDNFLHPKGRAVDIDNLVDSQGRNSDAGHIGGGANPAVDRAFAEYIANLLPHGGGVLQANKCFPATLPPGIRSGLDECTHIHVDVGTTVQ